MARAPRPALVALAALFAAVSASAGPIFTAMPEGDWFEGASWNGGVAPDANDSPVVDNGGTATGSSASPGAGTAIAVQTLAVGSRLDASAPADAIGAVELTDLDLVLAGNLWVGADGTTNEGTVSGSLAVLGGDQTSGNLTVAESYVGVLGLADGPDLSASSGAGALAVGGDLEATRLFEVGIARGPGVASGSVQVAGDLRITAAPYDEGFPTEFADVRVGETRTFEKPAEVTTTGSLSIGGNLEVVYGEGSILTTLEVGNASGGHTAGRVDVDGDMLGFQAFLVGFGTPGVDSVASGELHVAGTLTAAPVDPRAGVVSSVGETRSNLFGGIASAEGVATIGHLASGVNVNVGVAGGGPAVGSLAIGSGDLGAVTVGRSSSDADAYGAITTGGGLAIATVGVSEGGGFGDPFTVGAAVGSVIAGGSLRFSAQVGSVSSDGSANGYLEVESVQPIGTSRPGPIRVGLNGAGSGSAVGEVLVRSGGITAASVGVGLVNASGTATGQLESTGDVSTTDFIVGDLVGFATAAATGTADGTWILHDAHYSSRKLSVGLSLGAGTATGRLKLDQSRADIVELTLGAGSTVALDIRDLLAYSAIHAGVARLDGVLEVGFVGPAALGAYDLIVSGGADGILGDFDSVAIAGLGDDQHAFWGVETLGGASPVEVFRLYVAPEPSTAALLALGVVILAVRARRAR